MRPPRTVVLAALDGSTASAPVLQTALRLAQMSETPVEAVVVRDGDHAVARSLADQAGVACRVLEGPVTATLLAAIEEPEVLAAVLASRAPDGKRPIGRTARHILEHTSKPVVVVPPGAAPRGDLKALLIPLEGTEASSGPSLDALWPLLGPEFELVVLHVFTESTRPRMLDRPYHDLQLLGREFLAKHLPRTERIELRSGHVASRVAEVAEELGTGMVVLSWTQVSSPGRARVIRDVLESSALPVLLLPTVERARAEADPVPPALRRSGPAGPKAPGGSDERRAC